MWIDWSACVLTVVGFKLLGDKKILGWYLSAAGQLLWGLYGITTGQIPIVIINVIFVGIGIRNIIKWKR